jgi:probable phosphomutase (TIGR03848 family)
MLLLLIRHGLTSHTNVKLTGWLPGVSLSEEGKRQAESLVPRLEGLKIDALYSSPLERTKETGAPLAKARKLKIRTKADLGEVRYGDAQGKTLKSLAKTPIWTHLRAWPSDVRFPNGETLRETQFRAVSAIEDLRAEHANDTVAVFSHGDFIRLSLAHYMGVHIDLYRRLAIDPVSITAIEFGHAWVQIRRVNDTGTSTDLAPRIPAKPKGRKKA